MPTPSTPPSDFELEIKHLIVDSLMLTDVKAEQIDSTAALFGTGLGLDSIDALELAIAIGKRYRVKFSAEDSANKDTFRSVRTLADYVQRSLPAAAEGVAP